MYAGLEILILFMTLQVCHVDDAQTGFITTSYSADLQIADAVVVVAGTWVAALLCQRWQTCPDRYQAILPM